ncbi:MAG: AsnC family transcriptional regulator [Deltaproteobacteria bacterium]|nr:AsnC family transcriptional regulator [Deltaproteobacteria bacterium]
MRLSKKEMKLLACIELQAGLPLREIQRQCGLQIHTIRYFLNKLRLKGVVSRRAPLIDMSKLGYVHYTLFFSLSAERERQKARLVEFLMKAPLVTWIFELGGDFRYGVSMSAQHISEVTKFLDLLASKFGNIFFDKLLSVQSQYLYFGKRYLAQERYVKKPVAFDISQRKVDIDEQDEKILTALANEQYETVTELAEKIGIPMATLERRRRLLEEKGIISGYFLWIDTQLIGMSSYTILIYMRGIDIELRERLVKFSESEPRVVYFISCIGQWDFELGIEVPSARDVTQITEKLYDLFPGEIRTLKVVPILNYLKFKSYKVEARAVE